MQLRRTMLRHFAALPIAGEYMHRGAFDIADRYGRDTFRAIERLGTDRLPRLFAAKAWVDGATGRFVRNLSDRVLQRAGALLGDHLPRRMRDFRDRFEHHLLLKMPRADAQATAALLDTLLPGGWFECSAEEAAKAFLHRFVAAGAAVRYRAVHADTVEDIVALDVALPRNARDWAEVLPDDLGGKVVDTLYYGHFFCHVFHRDYIVRKGVDPLAFEHALWERLDAVGAQYPAEHNVGHLYPAKPALAGFYRSLDPRNQLNPGIGHMPRERGWEA